MKWPIHHRVIDGTEYAINEFARKQTYRINEPIYRSEQKLLAERWSMRKMWQSPIKANNTLYINKRGTVFLNVHSEYHRKTFHLMKVEWGNR